MRFGEVFDLQNQLQRSHQHENLIKNIEFTLFYETGIAIYLSLTLLALNNERSEICVLLPDVRIERFLLAIMFPVLIARFLSFLRFKQNSFHKLRRAMKYLSLYWNASFGVWTIIQLYRIVALSKVEAK
jgi:hypothetical protein